MVSGNGQQATMLASRPGQTQVLMPAGPQQFVVVSNHQQQPQQVNMSPQQTVIAQAAINHTQQQIQNGTPPALNTPFQLQQQGSLGNNITGVQPAVIQQQYHQQPQQPMISSPPAYPQYNNTGQRRQQLPVGSQPITNGGLPNSQAFIQQGSNNAGAIYQQPVTEQQGNVSQKAQGSPGGNVPQPHQQDAGGTQQQQQLQQEERASNNITERLDRVDCASVQSEPIRNIPVELSKRDSFSDSGAEGSGNNTPTRGRTYTEGLLRFVQDTSLQQKPERKTSNIEQPTFYATNTSTNPVNAQYVSVIQQAAPHHANTAGSVQPPYQKELSQEPTRPGSVASITSGIVPAALPPPQQQQYSLTPPSAGILYDPNSVQHFYRPVQHQQTIQQQQAVDPLVFQPQKSNSPSLLPTDALQQMQQASVPAVLGGETHSIRQPIMSSNAQPSMGYNAGVPPYMMMPSSISQPGMYSVQSVYQGSLHGNHPASPQILAGSQPGFHQLPAGHTWHHQGPGGFTSHNPNTVNYSSAGYPTSHQVNIAPAPPGSLVIPDPVPGSRIVPNPIVSMAHMPQHNLVNHLNQGVFQHPVQNSVIAQGFNNPMSMSNLAVNHGMPNPMGASYQSLPTLNANNQAAAFGGALIRPAVSGLSQLPLQQQHQLPIHQQQQPQPQQIALQQQQQQLQLQQQHQQQLSLQQPQQQMMVNQVAAQNQGQHQVLGTAPTNSAPITHRVSLNPTPAPSLQGQGVSLNTTPAPSLAGSLHESVHLQDDASVHGSEVGQ
jgi:hypothetical protein